MGLPDEVRAGFADFSFGQPCPESEIHRAESELGAALPAVLKGLYLAFDGFKGSTGAGFFWPLFAHGENDPGLVEMNLFFRGDDLFPQELMAQCIFFGDNGSGPQWGFKRDLPGKIILWDAGWGNEYEIAGDDPREVWTAEKRMYEDLDGQEEA